MTTSILTISGLTKRFAGIVATNNLSLDVLTGETHALIGPNGAGKTTLIAQLQGELKPDAGSIVFNGADITKEAPYRRAALGISRSFQITSIFPKFTVLANVLTAVMAQQGHSYRMWRDAATDQQLLEPARFALDTVGLSQRARIYAEELSHGERRQLELAMAVALKPSLLLLDEPMAGMGRHDGQQMTRILLELKSKYSIVIVEHDMDAVFALADRVSVLVAGAIIATGLPDSVRVNPAVKAAYLGHRA